MNYMDYNDLELLRERAAYHWRSIGDGYHEDYAYQ